ncbi:MAG: hypothetical protein HY223_00145 [Thaumarchaeota archaeon]|nr:hypothetical protein [Nitrososphaerota archaeon]
MTGVDDKNQVFLIGLKSLDDSKINVINKFLKKHKIPSDMIKLMETSTLTENKN